MMIMWVPLPHWMAVLLKPALLPITDEARRLREQIMSEQDRLEQEISRMELETYRQSHERASHR
jgi:hypothetical protein